MKLLGLIGGMSWENTIEYYRILNEMIKSELGAWNSAKILLYSVNFEEILPLQNKNEWNQIEKIMLEICNKLELAGCEAIIICSNTMHLIADNLERQISLPIINVIDETAKNINLKNFKKIGLLGTRFTMDGDFYVKKLVNKYKLKVLLPTKEEKEYINNAIYNEFAQGKFLQSTKDKFLDIISNFKNQGAEGIILGCTEIPMLIKQSDVDITLFDTLRIHLKAAVNFCLP